MLGAGPPGARHGRGERADRLLIAAVVTGVGVVTRISGSDQ